MNDIEFTDYVDGDLKSNFDLDFNNDASNKTHKNSSDNIIRFKDLIQKPSDKLGIST